MRAIVALVPAAVVAILIAFVPAFHAMSPAFSWFIGAGLGAVFYLLLADRTGGRLDDVERRADRRAQRPLIATRSHRHGSAMRILVVNVNTTETMTDSIAGQAAGVARPAPRSCR